MGRTFKESGNDVNLFDVYEIYLETGVIFEINDGKDITVGLDESLYE